MLSALNNKETQLLYVVDLDDSLLATDLLFERLQSLLVKAPLSFLLAPFMILRGKVGFKRWLQKTVDLDVTNLPYRKEIIRAVILAKQRGEKTILLSAALQQDVKAIADFLNIFDEAIGSDSINLRGLKKIELLNNRYPDASLTYTGDCVADLKIWSSCVKIIAVNPSQHLKSKISLLDKPVEIIYDKENQFSLVIKQLRIYQWVKNLLVFLPVFAAHHFLELSTWLHCLRAFFAFSFIASGVYVFNDICDLENDRKQESKKHRPLASGRLSVKTGLFLIPTCLALSMISCYGASWKLLAVLGCYLLMNVAYSFWVKEWLALDVVFLAIFYTLRIIAGGVASQTFVSEWLLSFSVFFFFGLAMVKRLSELKKEPQFLSKKVGRRAYESQDSMTLLVSGMSTSLLSILVLALYLSTGEVKKLYHHPDLLWFVTPCLLFWLNRLWILGARGLVSEDPLVFALKDKVTWAVALAVIFIVLGAI
ncbi:MAG: UbiA family prenyltransferase [Bdellovibrionales bacterium]|nr:UbiA family prenyltransferase [Bdellovibrionales bacterium]